MPMQSQHFSSPQIPNGRHFLNSRNALAATCIYTDILHLCCSKFTQKLVPSLHKPTTRYMCTAVHYGPILQVVHVNGSVHAKSGCRWSHSAGSRSPQRLFCTKSSMQIILIIKTRCSLTTEYRDPKQQFLLYCIASQQPHNEYKKAAALSTTPSTTPDHALIIWWLKPWIMNTVKSDVDGGQSSLGKAAQRY